MDITMTITVSAETAAKVVQLLNNVNGTAVQQSSPIQPAAQQFSAPVQQTPPVQAQFSAPVQQTPPAPIQQTAPTAPSTPTYTISQLQSAIAPLLDSGKIPQIQQLVQSFGVNTLMEIPPERYGEFANGLRALGGVL